MNNQNESNENMDDLEVQIAQEAEQLKPCLEKAKLMGSKVEMVKYQNFWCRTNMLKDIIHFQKHFKAQHSDIIIATQPKTGTTWLKSLLYTIVNRHNPDHQPLNQKSPLLTHNPHELVYHLEYCVYGRRHSSMPSPRQLHELPSPRLLQTHLPYASLPESIKTSSCKMVCIARNPFDTFVSLWYWYANVLGKWEGGIEFKPSSIEEFFEDFCLGKYIFGSYFDHIVEYWKQSIQQPNRVMFLKYEDLKGDHANLQLKKLAEFVGHPFSNEEENEGVIDDVMQLCSINNLKELEINKNGLMFQKIDNKHFFRKGEVGNWTNYFTPSIVERIDMLMQQKFEGTESHKGGNENRFQNHL